MFPTFTQTQDLRNNIRYEVLPGIVHRHTTINTFVSSYCSFSHTLSLTLSRSWTVETRAILSPLVSPRLTDLSIDLETSQFVSEINLHQIMHIHSALWQDKKKKASNVLFGVWLLLCLWPVANVFCFCVFIYVHVEYMAMLE